MELFLKADTWLALLTLCFLEIVLGIDNIIFISIVSNKLPEESRKRARNTGLFLAMFVRIGFLLGITWIIGFKEPLFIVNDILPDALINLFRIHSDTLNHAFSGRDLILGFGGLFLIAKSTMEINHEMEGDHDEKGSKKSAVPTLTGTIIQIILLDIIFSFDSILTAVGIVSEVSIMIMAVIVSIGVMMFFSGYISAFIQKHPSMEVLALGFLILIGFMLLLEALGTEVPKQYIYFAIAFSLLIELTNIRVVKKRNAEPVKLHKPFDETDIQASAATQEEIAYTNDPRYPIGKFEAKENYTDEELEKFIEKIETLPLRLEEAVKNLSDEQQDTPYRDGGWTVRQVVHHVADSHSHAYIRTKWALTENSPLIKAYNEKDWAQTPDAKMPVENSIKLLYTLHKKWSGLLKELKAEELSKDFIHPESKQHIQIKRIIATYAWHGDHHLAHINSLKRRMAWA